ncbi:MAG: indolepyruvate ferredoxin oxidoreductase subunit alpha [Clostridiales Family XIII bacterium]|jgi:indolepyruvate ferredoxin oxidoreductase alpha subunit|nr:indolepyruvate ferredoxin oxidoreductase subunit alpha [Clostridiales Family XIII bacterium]
MREKKLLTGNEAVARGAWEAGLVFASAYPGTPSTEILEALAGYGDDLYAEWAPNEKVAVEAAIGASMAGVRSMAAMKHVGVNVAADPLFTFAYTGVTGGMVLVSADDPGLHSSQNEQDNRNYAKAAKLLMLEPSDSAEAKAFMKLGLDLSERFDTPVLLRMTTRVCHSKSLVELEERKPVPSIPYVKNIAKYVATPQNARVMRKNLIGRYADELAYANGEAVEIGVNRIEWAASGTGDAENDGTGGGQAGEHIGVLTAGVSYQYARDVFGDGASYLKLGMTYPMPIALVREFAEKVDKLYVIEELEPYMESALLEAGIACIGKEVIPEWDELNTDIVRQSVFGKQPQTLASDILPIPRPPSLCAGCPHRGFFYALSKRKNVMITGDIGCYTLGSAPPLSAIDSCFCMGGSISTGHGAAKAFAEIGADTRVVSVIGDSTFFHSGVTSLMDVAYNAGNNTTVIMDNRITAMTGQQENPGTGRTLSGAPAPEVDIPGLCIALGIKKENIRIINPLDLAASNAALDAAFSAQGASVIITRWPCALKKFSAADKSEFDLARKICEIDQDKCTKCKMCVKTGCPAIRSGEQVVIDALTCTGCTVCKQVCSFGAISIKE